MIAIEPKRCPFCGSLGEVKVDPIGAPDKGKSMVIVGCSNPGRCQVFPYVTGVTREKAVEVWNRRAV